jgi:uncharacterized protein YecE (DUF72 family)
MGWSYSFWKGSFYPANLASKQFLTYYSKQFDTVEVDSTFYRIPRHNSVLDWSKQTPKGFMFSLKFPQVITHIKKLKNCKEETKVFLDRVELLKEKLGALLLQLPYSFWSDENVSFLRDFLQDLPKGQRYAVEIRNKKLLNDGFYSLLRNNNVALAWVESPFMSLTTEITADFMYVRWEGDRQLVKGTRGKRELEKLSNIMSWTERLRQISGAKTEIFGYFSKYYSGYPPSDAKDLLQSLKTEKPQI